MKKNPKYTVAVDFETGEYLPYFMRRGDYKFMGQACRCYYTREECQAVCDTMNKKRLLEEIIPTTT